MCSELEPYVFNKMSFTAVVAELDKKKERMSLTGIKIFNIVPTSETVWITEFDKFKDIPIGSLVKFRGRIIPVVKVEKRKLRYTIENIEIKSVKEFKLHTRDNLERYKNRYVMVEGTISKKSVAKLWEKLDDKEPVKTICIESVKVNGIEDVDHLWINEADGFEDIPEGSKVSFVGKVSQYNKRKKDIRGRLKKDIIKDYKVMDINNINLAF